MRGGNSYQPSRKGSINVQKGLDRGQALESASGGAEENCCRPIKNKTKEENIRQENGYVPLGKEEASGERANGRKET